MRQVFNDSDADALRLPSPGLERLALPTVRDDAQCARPTSRRRDRAGELIHEALASYRDLGMEPWEDKAGELERALQTAPAATR